MGLYQSLTPKGHILFSNARTISCLDLGVLTKAQREALTKDHAIRPCQSHVSKSGKKVYQGTKFLKITGSKPEFLEVKAHGHLNLWSTFLHAYLAM